MLWCLTTSQVLQMSRNFLPLTLVQWGRLSRGQRLRSQKKTNISFSSFKTYHHGGQKRVIDISFYFPALLLLIELESVLQKKCACSKKFLKKQTSFKFFSLMLAFFLWVYNFFFDTDSTSILYVPCTSNRGHLKCDDLILQQPPTPKNPLVVLLANLEKEEKDKIRSLMFVWIWGRITHWCLT